MFIQGGEKRYRLYVSPGMPDWADVPDDLLYRPYSPGLEKDKDGTVKASDNE
jgi:hypothetical protein